MFGGWRIVKTMGQQITKLKPVGGFCAETGGAITLFLATGLGIPVSTTHTITGAIVGVGLGSARLGGALGRRRQHRLGLDLHHPGLGLRRRGVLRARPGCSSDRRSAGCTPTLRSSKKRWAVKAIVAIVAVAPSGQGDDDADHGQPSRWRRRARRSDSRHALGRRQAVDDRRQHARSRPSCRAGERAGCRAGRRGRAGACRQHAVGADQRRQGCEPAPEVAPAVQVEAMQPEAAAERSPARSRPSGSAGRRSSLTPAGRRGRRRRRRAPSASAPRRASGRTSSPPSGSCRPARSRARGARRSSAALAESPITASICRAPRRFAAGERARPGAAGRSRGRRFPARGRPSPRGRSGRPAAAGTGWRRRSRATAPARSSDQPGQPLASDVGAPALDLGRSGGSISKVPVPFCTFQA